MKIKPYLFDAFIGLVSGILFFFVLPPLMYKGEFGIVGADFISKTFSSPPDLLTVGAVYSFLGAIVFVLARTLFIKRRHHNVFYGATFNLAHTIGQMLYFRPHNRFEDLDNCYLVGGGTHPGSGLPTIFESAKISAELLMQDSA